MQSRPLGRTGLSVSEIGFGAWGIGGGWGTTADEESLAALRHALDSGITFIDTAYGYGDGRSERLIGQVVRERGGTPPVIATKAPPANGQWPAAANSPVSEGMPSGHLTACTEESLRRLGLDRVDVQQIHVWAARWLHEGDWLDEVARLKADGKIGAFGISINDHQPDTALEVVASGQIDTVQVIYNIFDAAPEDALLPACQEHGVGVIVRVALDEGGLTGTVTADTTFPEDDWRSSYFRGDRPAQVAEHVDAILADLSITADQLPEKALRYVLSHPAVSSVIVGMRKPSRVDSNVPVGDGQGLPAHEIEILRRHRWLRNFYA